MDIIDNLLNPMNVINNHQELLLSLYEDEYGLKYVDTIKKRMENIIYFFESRPDITYLGLKELGIDAEKHKGLSNIYLKYLNYIILEHHFSLKYVDSCMRLLSSLVPIPYTSIDTELNCAEIIELDFNSFSSKTENLLSTTENETVKKKILERRRKYLEDCEDYKINPLTNKEKIDKYLMYKEIYLEIYKESLIKDTIYGSDIITFIRQTFNTPKIKMGSNVVMEIAKSLCFREKKGSNLIVGKNKDDFLDIVHIPLFFNFNSGTTDLAVLHETYHAIETKEDITGIQFCKELNILNEFRIELKSINQLNKLRGNNIRMFDDISIKGINRSIYDDYLFLSRCFLEKYSKVLDYSAINSNKEVLFDFFGKENLLEYGSYLNYLYKTSSEYQLTRSKINKTNLTNKEHQLEEHFKIKTKQLRNN